MGRYQVVNSEKRLPDTNDTWWHRPVLLAAHEQPRVLTTCAAHVVQAALSLGTLQACKARPLRARPGRPRRHELTRLRANEPNFAAQDARKERLGTRCNHELEPDAITTIWHCYTTRFHDLQREFNPLNDEYFAVVHSAYYYIDLLCRLFKQPFLYLMEFLWDVQVLVALFDCFVHARLGETFAAVLLPGQSGRAVTPPFTIWSQQCILGLVAWLTHIEAIWNKCQLNSWCRFITI